MKKILVIILIVSLLSGCSWFEDKRVRVEPKFDVTSLKHRKMLIDLLNNRYDNKHLKWIAADLALAEYKMSLE